MPAVYPQTTVNRGFTVREGKPTSIIRLDRIRHDLRVVHLGGSHNPLRHVLGVHFSNEGLDRDIRNPCKPEGHGQTGRPFTAENHAQVALDDSGPFRDDILGHVLRVQIGLQGWIRFPSRHSVEYLALRNVQCQ